MNARLDLRHRPLLTALLALVAAVAPTAFAAIGEAPSTILDALKSYQPSATEQGYTAGDGFHFSVASASGVATGVSGEGTLDDANVRLMADLLGAASGYGQAIAGPVAQFLRTQLAGFVGQGEVGVGVEEYVLHLTVTGAAPFHLSFRFGPQTVDPSLFPPASHSLGPADASHVIRIFSDFECPFCKRFAEDTMPALKVMMVARHDVRLEFHDYPLQSIHPNAMSAAEAAECVTAANDPAAFWTYHDALFAQQSSWAQLPDPVASLVGIAAAAGLKTGGVAACIREGTYQGRVEKAYRAAAADLHLDGTPTLFVDNLKVGDYTKLDSFTRLLALSDALRASSQAGGQAGGGSAPSAGGSGR